MIDEVGVESRQLAPDKRFTLDSLFSRLLETQVTRAEREKWRKSRLLAALSGILAVAGLSAGLVWGVFAPNANLTVSLAVSAGTIFLLIYVLNRQGYYATAAYFTIGVIAISSYALVLYDSTTTMPFAYLLVAVLLCSILLSLQSTFVMAVTNIVGIVITLALIGRSFEFRFLTPLIVNVAGSFSILMATYFQRLLEQDRLNELKKSEQQQAAIAELNARLFRQAQDEIVERKRVEEQLREAHQELEQRVTDRTAHLTAVNSELEAFSYSVSHDLRAPLRAIDGFAQALVEDYSAQLDATGQNYLQRVRAASQRMGHLIDDLLQLSRLSRASLKPQSIDLSQCVSEIADELRSRDPDRQVVFNIQPGVVATADVGLMNIVLENLLNNAWKFTSKVETAEITFGTTTEADKTVYFVRDNGAGFDMQYADKLFMAFHRLHSGTDFEGSGVGLATVKRVIHRHGGKVWVNAAVDRGACFFFTVS